MKYPRHMSRPFDGYLSKSIATLALGSIMALGAMPSSFAAANDTGAVLKNPDGMIDLILAPEVIFDGRIFLLNDWDGGDKDNQNVGEELNRNSKIK